MSGLGIGNRRERRAMMAITKRTMKNGAWGPWEHRFGGHNPPPHGAPFVDGWCNRIFSVQRHITPGWDRVMVRTHDSRRIHWSELQRIKNELFGEERIAIQMLPRQSDLVDSANMYWFFLIPEEKTRFFDLMTNNGGALSALTPGEVDEWLKEQGL